MSTILKRKFFWILKQGQVLVYSDEGRLYRENFIENNPTITPHNAIELVRQSESTIIDISRVATKERVYLQNVLEKQGVEKNKIIF